MKKYASERVILKMASSYKYLPRTFHNCKLQRIVDADTMDLHIDCGFSIRHTIRVRILDIDTAEKYGKFATDESKAQSRAAVEAAQDLLGKETFTVTTYVAESTKNEKRDGFRRFLADITLQDGRDYAATMRSMGHHHPRKGGVMDDGPQA